MLISRSSAGNWLGLHWPPCTYRADMEWTSDTLHASASHCVCRFGSNDNVMTRFQNYTVHVPSNTQLTPLNMTTPQFCHIRWCELGITCEDGTQQLSGSKLYWWKIEHGHPENLSSNSSSSTFWVEDNCNRHTIEWSKDSPIKISHI